MDQVDALLGEYRAAADDATRLVQTQPHARLTSRPSPARWCAVECIQHLTISNDAFHPRLVEAVERARRLPPPQRPFALDLKTRLLKWVLEPPYRLRFPTGAAFVAQEEIEPQEALERFLASHGRLAALLDSSRGLALASVKIASPFAEKLEYSAWAAFVVAVAHERRHLWQAHRSVAV